MKHRFESGFFSAADKTQLFYRLWQKDTHANLLIILHGHGEHSGRYEKFAQYLDEQNLTLAAYDFRGHGRSEGPEVYVNSYDDFVQDVSAFYEFLKKKLNFNQKIFILGHSNGGLTAVHWALTHYDKIKALFLSSPFLGLKLPGPILFLNNEIMHRVMPGFVWTNPVYPPHLTHNPEEVINYRKDKLIKRKISVRLLYEMLSYMAKLDRLEKISFPFPVYILMSGLEKVVDSSKTRTFFEKLECPHKELKVFEGFYHEIFNELEQEQAFDALKQYLNSSSSFSK